MLWDNLRYCGAAFRAPGVVPRSYIGNRPHAGVLRVSVSHTRGG